MNCKSRSSLSILAAALAVACTKSDDITLVRPEAYGSRACWFDQRGDFVAFLVLAKRDRVAAPHLISTNCLVNGGYPSNGVATILHLGTIRMADSYGSLQRAFPQIIISDNIRTDRPLPHPDSKLYYFRARLRTVTYPHGVVYAPRNIVELADMNMSFEHFLDLSREQRERLLSEYNRGLD